MKSFYAGIASLAVVVGALAVAVSPEAHAQVECDPSLGPCAGTKVVGKVNKADWPSFDALCAEEKKCKIVFTNEYIQIGGTRIPRDIVSNYTMDDKSNYGCEINGRPCKPILLGTVYYSDGSTGAQKAATFEFRNVKPVLKLNEVIKEWLGAQ